MESSVERYSVSPLVWTVLAGIAAIVFLAAFGGWMVFGADIFLAMTETGLSWCL